MNTDIHRWSRYLCPSVFICGSASPANTTPPTGGKFIRGQYSTMAGRCNILWVFAREVRRRCEAKHSAALIKQRSLKLQEEGQVESPAEATEVSRAGGSPEAAWSAYPAVYPASCSRSANHKLTSVSGNRPRSRAWVSIRA